MKRESGVDALIAKAHSTFADLERAYEAALGERTIREDLKVDIKNIFENLRSCLDYLAHELHEGLCPSASKPSRLYFPIRRTRPDFDQAMRSDYPGLEISKQAVFDYLESIQPYNDPWLGVFNQLNNQNKHQDLVEQTRTETRHVSVSRPGGGAVSWGPGVRFGGRVSIMGVPIDPRTQLPVANNQVETKITIWVDFQFKDNGLSVLPFIQKSIDRVAEIFHELQQHL